MLAQAGAQTVGFFLVDLVGEQKHSAFVDAPFQLTETIAADILVEHAADQRLGWPRRHVGRRRRRRELGGVPRPSDEPHMVSGKTAGTEQLKGGNRFLSVRKQA